MHHWSLIGLGMKLAVGVSASHLLATANSSPCGQIGLHRDGKRWDLDPAEAELRRALWWEVGRLSISV